jgi:hypothetical protein
MKNSLQPLSKHRLNPAILRKLRDLAVKMVSRSAVPRIKTRTMNFDQGELNFDIPANDANGYQKWRDEMDVRKKEIESRYGIILGKPVLVILRGENNPLQGILTIASKTLPKIRSQLLLQLGKREFTLAQIESIARL